MEEYAVESVAADIIVNANESNYPLPQEIAEKITQRTARFPLTVIRRLNRKNLCEVIAKELDVDIVFVTGNGSSELLEKACYVFGGRAKRLPYLGRHFPCTASTLPFPTARRCAIR